MGIHVEEYVVCAKAGMTCVLTASFAHLLPAITRWNKTGLFHLIHAFELWDYALLSILFARLRVIILRKQQWRIHHPKKVNIIPTPTP